MPRDAPYPHDPEPDRERRIEALTNWPERARLMAQRYSERQRIGMLRHRLNETDPSRTPHAYHALEDAVRNATERLAEIEAQLSAPTDREIACARPRAHAKAATTQQAKDWASGRLRLFLVQLETLPEGCAEAAAILRSAIHRELRRLTHLKAVERRKRERNST